MSHYRIDVHHHALPPVYMEALERLGIKQGGAAGVPFPEDWSPAASLALMDSKGIQAAVVSIASPGVWMGGARTARDLARRNNEYLAGMVADHPTRFGAFAVVPLPDVEAAVGEAVYALDTLGADGVGLLASTEDRYLGDPRYEELMQELDRRSAVVFVHPHLHSSSRQLGLGIPETLFEFVVDTSRAALNLVLSGTMERYPNIRWILAHAGGTVPFLAWRWALADTAPRFREVAPKGVVHYLRQLYFETALSVSPFAMKPALDLGGPGRLVFGSDFPFAHGKVVDFEIDSLDALPVFDDATRAAMEHGNALALFPKLAARIAAKSPGVESAEVVRA
jgi:6-methylsalicylate decarboxylase